MEATLARLEASMQAFTNTIDNNTQTLNDAMKEVSHKISDNEERINNTIDDKIVDLKKELK
jgi:gas vesicle protein